ncbi:MAG: PKD domain-containing protein [Actinomycetota bacterium]|nr:PKD domain-containing protein [Actinomycetota bacterium]
MRPRGTGRLVRGLVIGVAALAWVLVPVTSVGAHEPEAVRPATAAIPWVIQRIVVDVVMALTAGDDVGGPCMVGGQFVVDVDHGLTLDLIERDGDTVRLGYFSPGRPSSVDTSWVSASCGEDVRACLHPMTMSADDEGTAVLTFTATLYDGPGDGTCDPADRLDATEVTLTVADGAYRQCTSGTSDARFEPILGDRHAAGLFLVACMRNRLTSPIACIEVNRTHVVGYGEIVVDSSCSSDDIALTDRLIVWGDGFVETSHESEVFDHVYTEPGTYEVSFGVSDGEGLSDRETFEVTVEADPAAPDARISGPDEGTAGVPVTFDAGQSSPVDAADPIVSLTWETSDGATSTVPWDPAAATFTHAFPMGNHTVEVTVETASGHRDLARLQISVSPDWPMVPWPGHPGFPP